VETKMSIDDDYEEFDEDDNQDYDYEDDDDWY